MAKEIRYCRTEYVREYYQVNWNERDYQSLLQWLSERKDNHHIARYNVLKDLSFDDIRWLLGMLNWKGQYNRNKKLLDYTLSANVYDVGIKFSVPMYFISGEYDKSCCVNVLKEYYEAIIAPAKKIVIIEKCAHSPQIDEPVLFATEVKKLLRS